MRRLLRWSGNVVSIAYGGPGIVDLDDPGLVLPPADAAAPRWVTAVAILTPLVLIVLILLAVPWPIVAIVAAALRFPLLIGRSKALRSR